MIQARRILPRVQAEQFFAAPDPRSKEPVLYRDSSALNGNKQYGDYWWSPELNSWLIYTQLGTIKISTGDWVIKTESGALDRVSDEQFRKEFVQE